MALSMGFPNLEAGLRHVYPRGDVAEKRFSGALYAANSGFGVSACRLGAGHLDANFARAYSRLETNPTPGQLVSQNQLFWVNFPERLSFKLLVCVSQTIRDHRLLRPRQH